MMERFHAEAERREVKGRGVDSWGDFSLSTSAFGFWDDPEEVEYSLEDLKCLLKKIRGRMFYT